MKVGTLNIGTTSCKDKKLADMMERRKVDILCVRETRWNGSKVRNIGGGFQLFYPCVDRKRNGVGVILKEQLVKSVLCSGCQRVSDRIISCNRSSGQKWTP